MHHWGDGFEYFGEVGQAADEIGVFCRRWGRIQVTQTKEKYGTARVYCSFGLHQLFSITHPGYAFSRYPKWLWTLDCLYISKLFNFLRLNKVVVPYQLFVYRLAYTRALKKYPFIAEEILDGADYTEELQNLYKKYNVECSWIRHNPATGKWEKLF